MPFLDVMAMGGGLPAVQMKGAADGSTVVAGGGTHIVKEKETLWTIAEGEYGDGKYWTRIRDANPGRVVNGHLVKVGAELVLPRIEVPTLAAMREKIDARNDQDGLRDLAVGMSDDQYGAFLSGLDQAEKDANGKLLQIVEMMRSTGRTLEELGDDQRAWIELEAARLGKFPGQVVRERVDKEGHGGRPTKDWDKLDEPTRGEWKARFDAVEAAIRAKAPPDV